MTRTLAGGCQCGRVRYVATLESDDAYLCHCRMCRKATGGFAAAFVSLPQSAVAWDNPPDWYDSSPVASRPFCSHCGSPLGFAFNTSDHMDLTIGSFDEPQHFVPVSHSGTEGVLHESWLDTRFLPRTRSDEAQSVVSQWRNAGLTVPE